MLNAWTIVKGNPLVCSLAVLAAAAFVFVSEISYSQSRATLERLAQGQRERSNVRELQVGVLDAETAQRGYLLTGRKAYLEPYTSSIKGVGESLDLLDHHYAGTPLTHTTLAALRRAVAAKQDEMQQTLRLHDEGLATAALELLISDVGTAEMEKIRKLTIELLRQDIELRDGHRANLQATLALSRLGVASLSLIALIAMALYLGNRMALRANQVELKRVAQVEHDRLEVEVRQRTAELTDLTRHLLTAREDERNRLARNLHDDLGGLLTSAKLDAARIKARLGNTAPEAQERLVHLVATLNASIALGRRIIEDLRPSTLANLGLVSALEILAREFGERAGVPVHCALAQVKLSATAELVVYRLVQEAITNLSKYAKASQVWINLLERNGRVEASVRDDGVGFDTTIAPTSAYGLLGMRYRVEVELGRLAVTSAPGRGTTVSLSLPPSLPASVSA